MKSPNKKIIKGFTLIELLIVIGILAILMAITLIALNPAKQFAQANDTKRSSDVNALLNGVQQYAIDHQGNYSALSLPSSATVVGSGVGQVNLCAFLVPTYMAALPVDPQTNNGAAVTNCGAAYNTNYTILVSATNSRISVAAPASQIQATISVTR